MKVTDIEFQSAQHVVEEIENMNVKGGSPFGRAAAWAHKLTCEQEVFSDKQSLCNKIDEISQKMTALKPTMATINNTNHLVKTYLEALSENVSLDEAKKGVINLCNNIIDYSLLSVEKLGEFGANLIQNGTVVMMHSYSSTLMSCFVCAAKSGKKFTVISTESRPLRESRLAVKIMQSYGISVIYITDASAWEFMPKADMLIMGADTIACDGSVANKMGTAMLSQLALYAKKPVYIASEVYKLDLRTKMGYPIELERRTKDEIILKDDFDSLENVEIINQFFDLTPARNITGLITEFGVINPATVEGYWAQIQRELLK